LGTHQISVLNGFSEHVVPRPADWNEHVHVTGYWFPKDRPSQPPQDLQEFIEAGTPPIFIGFGSMSLKNPQKATEIILEALQQSGQRGILHMGWGGLGNQDLPNYVFKINYAPYGWLFPRMALVIHHGGSGTTSFVLRAGIPSCVVPFVFDQLFWGNRVAELGVGPNPIPYKSLSVERLTDAILLGTSDPLMRQRAFELGRKIQAENGIENSVQLIEQILMERKRA